MTSLTPVSVCQSVGRTRAARCVAHAAPVLPSRRAALAGAVIMPVLLHAEAALAVRFDDGPLKRLLVDQLISCPVDYRACMRLLFNDVVSGGHNGSVCFELARLHNAGLAPVVASLASVKAAVDAQNLAAAPLSWTDLISFAARTRAKAAFDQILYSRAAPGKGEALLRAYANDFALPPLGGVDATEAGPESPVPALEAGAAAWRACFMSLGLSPLDLAFLGPDVIAGDAEQVEAMLREDVELRGHLDRFAIQKALLTRTPWEVPYTRAFAKLVGVGLRLDKSQYL